MAVLGVSLAGAAEPLFSDDAILELTIHAPFSRLKESAGSAEFKGVIELEDGARVAATLSTYGISRLEVCDACPLKLEFSSDEVAGTPFAGLSIVRVIPPCQFDDEYEQYAVLEYLVYRSYQTLASPAIRVRPVDLQIKDSERGRKVFRGFGYVVEDLDHTASRTGFTWLDEGGQEKSDFDAAQLTSVALFQFMVGNTDWSVVRSSDGERCCHNIALFGEESHTYHTLVPFDFDQAGMVNSPYAKVDSRLGIRRVTERLYRGFCWHNDQLEGTIQHYNSKRHEIEALFKRSDLPHPRARKTAFRYLKSFYHIVDDPQKVEKKLLAECRE